MTASAVLRKLFLYTPRGNLTDQILERWVLLPYHDGTLRWTACLGAYCAKLLARLSPEVRPNQAWSLLNGMYDN